MKKLIIISILSSFIIPIQAQNLISDSATWHYSISQNGGTAPPNTEYVKYEAIKDTLFNGKTAVKIEREYFQYSGDSVQWDPLYLYDSNDTVYYYNSHYQRYLPLYDFTASIGDTLSFYVPDTNGISLHLDSSFRIVVDSIQYKNFNGKSLKAVYTSPLDGITISGPNSDLPYVERIGSMSIMLPRSTIMLEHDGPLRCYEDDSLFVNFTNQVCGFRIVSSLNELSSSKSVFQIQPNPISSSAKIIFENVEVEQVDLINIRGQLVKSFSIKENKINFSDVSNGVYFVRVMTTNQVQYTQKVVVQR